MNKIETLAKNNKGQKSLKRKKKRMPELNLQGNLNENIAKLIKYYSTDESIELQLMNIEEMESVLQKELKYYKIKVSDLSERTNRAIVASSKIVPKKYRYRHIVKDILKESSDVELIIEDDVEYSVVSNFNRYKGVLKDKKCTNPEILRAISINIELNGQKVLERSIFTIPGITLMSNLENHTFSRVARSDSPEYAEDNKYRILDLNQLMGILKLNEACFEYVNNNVSLLYDKKNSYFENEYTTNDFLNILNTNILSEPTYMLDRERKEMICDCMILINHTQTSQEFTDKYNKEISDGYAKSFQTKKNIPKLQKIAMANNTFLKDFTFVELDEKTDVSKFRNIEKEYNLMREKFDLETLFKAKAELRVRRLGQHKADGLYYPDFRCICIDINSPSSFIHEMGHHIDNTWDNSTLKLSDRGEFSMLAIEYKKALEETAQKLAMHSKEVVDFYKRKRWYFHMPTEIFARCLEIYFSIILDTKSSFLKSNEEYSLRGGYPEISARLKSKIEIYFKSLLGEMPIGVSLLIEDSKQMEIDFSKKNKEIKRKEVFKMIGNRKPNSINKMLDEVNETAYQLKDKVIKCGNKRIVQMAFF